MKPTGKKKRGATAGGITDMGAWETLLQQAQPGKRTAPVEPPKKPIAAANDATPTPSLPAVLSGAISALTAAEQALLDTPAILAALVAELPTCCGWEAWPIANRRGWIQERLGLSASRFWVITMNGRRDLVEFVEPQTREALLERAAQTRPGIGIEVTPALPLKALCDNANKPVDKSEIALCDNDNPPMEPDMQQATLLPDTASLATGPAVATVSAAELLTGAGVAVRYLVEPGAAEQALSELATLPDTGPWGLDIETMPLPAFRQDSKAGLDPWRSSIRLVQVYPGGSTCYVFDVATLGLSALQELLQARAFVAHNAVFELKFLLHAGAAPARLGCTLLQDNALGNGRRSLAALVKERLDWAMDKTLQVSDWTAANLTGAQVEYAALDAVAAYQLARVQAPQLQQRDLSRCYQLMRDAQRAIAQLELNGCPFDTAAHTALIAQWQSTAEQARGELDSLLNGANPDSPLQLSKWLSANLPAETLAAWPRTATGQLQTNADALAGLTLPALEPLARYKTAIKGLSTYGKGYAAHISPVTGRIHANFTLGGTATGRLSCSSPNIQNPPRDPAFRALFAPTPGRCLVVADYGQIELRVAALVSGDPAMLAVYEQGEDLHRKTAAAFLGKEPSAVSKAERQIAKGINFGMLFGSGAKGLQAFCKSSYGVDLSLAQADKARAAFFTAYPGLSAWQKQTRNAAELAKQVRTPGGRVRGLDKNIGTECLNTPVQGGAAECLLATLAALDVDSLGGRLVNIVHDELVVECAPEQAGAVSAAVEAAMVAGFLAIFPTGSTRDLVEAHSGPNWAAAKG
jgi:DNA polymerase-1